MPNDTLWLNNLGGFILLDSGKDMTEEQIKLILNPNNDTNRIQFYQNEKNTDFGNYQISKIKLTEKKVRETEFNKEVAYYDNIYDYLQYGIWVMAIFIIIYAYRKAKKYKENPFEEENDWIEIGSGSILGTYREREEYQERMDEKRRLYPPILVYNGRQLNFSAEELRNVLIKRFPFYNTLSTERKIIFVQRLQKFIKTKDFKIHDKNGFKEMPILLSATAIQLSFGLEDYLLPHYDNIHVFPSEFLGLEPSIRFLVGNVSKNNINISWKHFLEGYENFEDGYNVGLHEMAHAYYCQYVVYKKKENQFATNYKYFRNEVATTIAKENELVKKLYSENGLRNEEEFWAESVELFFEKPKVLKNNYHELYQSICKVLNQDLANNPA